MSIHLAIDIGASSGRHILGFVENGRMVMEEVYRFHNQLIQKDGLLCWDIDELFRQVLEGLRICKEKGRTPSTIGIDTWGVDFVLLDNAGKRIGEAVSYRDSRTKGMDSIVEERIPLVQLYQKTGIQKLAFNTIYQLTALSLHSPETLKAATHLLLIPDYLHYLLTGQISCEYCNATTTSLVNAADKQWDWQIIDALGFPKRLFQPLRQAGSFLGGLRKEVQEAVGFNSEVILPATHDTASAFMAAPAKDRDAAYLSSGTWSLLGAELDAPITTEASLNMNFTNEGGYGYRYRYLKNIMGLWMVQSVRKELKEKISFPELSALAQGSQAFPAIIDVLDQRFLAPTNMTREIAAACAEAGYTSPKTTGETVQCIYQSLAACYRNTVNELAELTGRKISALHIVGGGSQNDYLNRMTAEALGIKVYAGPTESSALGNLIAQMIACNQFADLACARDVIRDSFPVSIVQ